MSRFVKWVYKSCFSKEDEKEDENESKKQSSEKTENVLKKAEEHLEEMKEYLVEDQKDLKKFDEKTKNQKIEIRRVLNEIRTQKELELHTNNSAKPFHVINSSQNKNAMSTNMNDFKGTGRVIGEDPNH